MTPTEIADLRQKRYNGTVLSVTKSHSDLMIIRVKSDFPRPVHLPGQYCTLGLGNWEPRMPGCQEETLKPTDETKVVRRAYSIACSILGDDDHLLKLESTEHLEFYIVLVREGSEGKPPALTPRLFMLKEGDRVQIGEKITGHYNLEGIKPTDTILLLGTGTGEAPHNYMTWQLLSQGHLGKIINACCVRYKRDLGYFDIHQKLMARFPQYRYLALTTRETDTITHKVYIQELISSGQLESVLGQPLDPQNTHAFLCGNPKMIGVKVKNPATGELIYPIPIGVIEVLEKRGFQADNATIKFRGNIHFEEYW
jgi:ferredoxin/flavodoxin---NADP+ reductase